MNPIKPNLKTELLPIALVAIAVVSSFFFYVRFPEQVPSHWNLSGEVDNYSSRGIAFVMPAVIAGMYLLFLLIPLLDPKKERYEQFRKIYHIFKSLIIGMMAVLYFIISFNALGYNIPVNFVVPIVIGLLFIFLGNYMGKIKPNWFMGIRTPWTLSSEEVWNKTHRFGGKVFIVGGLVLMVINFLPVWMRLYVFIADILFIVFGTIVFSYILYSKENNNKQKNASHNQSAEPKN